ncbi:MAG: amino acid ABC transporter permease [Prochloraceae cyanobacterium]
MSFWRNAKVLGILAQVVVVLLVIALLVFLGDNLIYNFELRGLNFGFNFLNDPASFPIGTSLIDYNPSNSYLRAVIVGFLNTLIAIAVGIILATTIGIAIGIGKLSNNWLVRQIATIYVEIFRNTPLLLQLFFWYSVFLQLPTGQNSLTILEAIFLSNQGLFVPKPATTTEIWLALGSIASSFILAFLFWRTRGRAIATRRSDLQLRSNIFAGTAIVPILIVLFVLDWQIPILNRDNGLISGGANLSLELTALIFGLAIYTAAFIAEVVRAGIDSVNTGQWEAARALGLKGSLAMRLIIFPQALRVMIPPLTSEYLNLAKNSSLATAIGYPDIYSIAFNISEQTGRSLEILLIVMASYLSVNLIISLIMNLFNKTVQLKEK